METVSSDGELGAPSKVRKASVGLAMLGEMQVVLEDLCKDLQSVGQGGEFSVGSASSSSVSVPRFSRKNLSGSFRRLDARMRVRVLGVSCYCVDPFFLETQHCRVTVIS